MRKALAFILSVVLSVCLFSACKENKKQYLQDDYNNYVSQNATSDSISSDKTSTSNNSSEKVASTDKNTSQNSSETIDKVELKEHQLPNLNLESEYLREYELQGRYVKKLSYATAEDYNTYLNNVIKLGFTKYDENKIGNNLFATLVNKTTFVSISFTFGNKALKVVSEPLGDLYPRKSENKYQTKSIQSLFTGMKGENIVSASGLGFIIRLDDGSFIIIDGGAGDYDSVDSKKLMNILREQSPKGTPKPVIAAWIFTHPHEDHIGVFNAFSIDFHEDVVIESFYYNFVSDAALFLTAQYMFNDEYYGYNRFMDCMTEFYPNVTKIRPHSGEKYYIKNAVIEMLFTHEDLLPESFENGGVKDLNESSLIFTIEIGGQKMMITGDVGDKGMNFASVNFGENLKCDILQMSHHGQNGTVNFYSKVDPVYAILPVSYSIPSRFTFNEANRWLVESKNVRQFIEFGKSNVTFPLPYTPDNDDIGDRIPKENTKYKEYPLH